MRLETASRGNREGIRPPSTEERAFAMARGFGDSITGAQLTEIRAQIRAGKRAAIPTAIKPTLGSTVPIETLAERKLKKKVERLKNQISMLKVQLMTSK